MSDENGTKETQVLSVMQPRLPVALNAMAQGILDKAPTLMTFLPPGLNPQQFLGSLVQQANVLNVSLDPKEIADKRTIVSFMRAAFNCAVLGLIPGEVLGHAYLIPYQLNRGKASQFTSINLIPGYKGLLELAFASGYLEVCQPEIVLDGEACKFWHSTDGPQVEHEIPINRDEPKTDNVIAAYCTFTPRGGSSTVGKIVTGRELKLLARKASRRSPWNAGSYGEMCCKTSVRRTSKQWRLTRQLAWAVDLDEQAERSEVQQALVADEVVSTQETIDLDELPEVNQSK